MGRASVILPALILCPPLGLYLVWRHSGWDTATRWSMAASELLVVAALAYPAEAPAAVRVVAARSAEQAAGATAVGSPAFVGGADTIPDSGY